MRTRTEKIEIEKACDEFMDKDWDRKTSILILRFREDHWTSASIGAAAGFRAGYRAAMRQKAKVKK
jgi:hypothetical protein